MQSTLINMHSLVVCFAGFRLSSLEVVFLHLSSISFKVSMQQIGVQHDISSVVSS